MTSLNPGLAAAERAALALLLLLLGGCQWFAAPTPPPAPPPAPVVERDLIAAVRTGAEYPDSQLEVNPVRLPAIEALEALIFAREAAGDHAGALALTDEALSITTDDPLVWQVRAELLLKLERLPEAIELAQRAFELGPKVGALCVRAWRVVVEAERAASNEAQAQNAAARAERCVLRPRPRF